MRFRAPANLIDWSLLLLHCALTLGAQLSLAAGFATTRAGTRGSPEIGTGPLLPRKQDSRGAEPGAGSRLAAGIGGFLQLTELAWVYAIDITLLAEPTNLFASLGTALVFASALAVLRVSSPSTTSSSKQGVVATASGGAAGLRERLLAK